MLDILLWDDLGRNDDIHFLGCVRARVTIIGLHEFLQGASRVTVGLCVRANPMRVVVCEYLLVLNTVPILYSTQCINHYLRDELP